MFLSLSTLTILAVIVFLLGFISPFALLCYWIVRAKVD